MDITSLAPLALAAGYIYQKEQDFAEQMKKINKSLSEQKARNLELQDKINQQMIQLNQDVDQKLQEEGYKTDLANYLKCTAEIHLSGMGDKFWMAAFWVNIHNTLAKRVTISGIRMTWTVDGYTSIWMPYFKGTLYIGADSWQEVRLSSAYNRKLFDTKNERKAVKKVAKADGEGICDILFLTPSPGNKYMNDGFVVKGVVAKVESHGNRVYANGKNGAGMDYFNNYEKPNDD